MDPVSLPVLLLVLALVIMTSWGLGAGGSGLPGFAQGFGAVAP